MLYIELVLLVHYFLLTYCKQTAFAAVAVTDSWMQPSWVLKSHSWLRVRTWVNPNSNPFELRSLAKSVHLKPVDFDNRQLTVAVTDSCSDKWQLQCQLTVAVIAGECGLSLSPKLAVQACHRSNQVSFGLRFIPGLNCGLSWASEHMSGAGVAEFPLVAQTYFCDSHSPLRSPFHDLPLQPVFFTPAHRSAPAHQIFGPLRFCSALVFQAAHLKRWTHFSFNVTYRPICIH